MVILDLQLVGASGIKVLRAITRAPPNQQITGASWLELPLPLVEIAPDPQLPGQLGRGGLPLLSNCTASRLNYGVNCLRPPIGRLPGTCCPRLKVSVESCPPHNDYLCPPQLHSLQLAL